jgi:acetyl esterase
MTAPLHPQTQLYLDRLHLLGAKSTYHFSPSDAKKGFESMILSGGPPEPLASVEDRAVPGPYGPIPVRIYVPEGERPFGVLQYMHGGGWEVGSIFSYDAVCRTIAYRARCIVVSVDYRLTPEFVYPVQVNECYTVLQWIAEHARMFQGDPTRIAVGGDSAGGNLTAVMTLKARDERGPSLKFQFLIYPVTDYYQPGTASYQEFNDQYFLTARDMKNFFDLYLPHSFDRDDPYIFPLCAKDLSNLPPALIINADHDVLLDDGVAYANRLKHAGIPVQHTIYPGIIHTFINLRGLLDQSNVAHNEIAAALQAAFAH